MCWDCVCANQNMEQRQFSPHLPDCPVILAELVERQRLVPRGKGELRCQLHCLPEALLSYLHIGLGIARSLHDVYTSARRVTGDVRSARRQNLHTLAACRRGKQAAHLPVAERSIWISQVVPGACRTPDAIKVLGLSWIRGAEAQQVVLGMQTQGFLIGLAWVVGRRRQHCLVALDRLLPPLHALQRHAPARQKHTQVTLDANTLRHPRCNSPIHHQSHHTKHRGPRWHIARCVSSWRDITHRFNTGSTAQGHSSMAALKSASASCSRPCRVRAFPRFPSALHVGK